MSRAALTRLHKWVPRITALVWAGFTTSTAWAYHGKIPAQLSDIETLTPIPLWGLWATSSVLLILGGIAPTRPHTRAHDIARYMRSAGIALAAGLLMLWSLTYFEGDGRYWVSGKNYLMLSILGLLNAWTIGKDEVT